MKTAYNLFRAYLEISYLVNIACFSLQPGADGDTAANLLSGDVPGIIFSSKATLYKQMSVCQPRLGGNVIFSAPN